MCISCVEIKHYYLMAKRKKNHRSNLAVIEKSFPNPSSLETANSRRFVEVVRTGPTVLMSRRGGYIKKSEKDAENYSE